MNAQGTVFEIAEKCFIYDNNGNLCSVQTSLGASPETTEYTYDYENRLVSVLCPLSSVLYTYDGTGKRIKVNDNGTVTNYFYDGLTPIIERNASGDVIAQYTRGGGFGGGIGSIINKIVPQGAKKQTKTYYHYDGIGNVVDHTDEAGKHGAWYEYDAFGNVLRQGGSKNDQHQFQFSTKEKESTGLVYFGARYYNPQLGRWITKDPMGMIDGPNVYAYVGNNPVNYIDPLGLCKEKGTTSFLDELQKYLIEVGDVMVNDHPYSLDFQGLLGQGTVVAGTASAYGYIPKGIGYSNADFLHGGRVAYRWANQYGSGVKAMTAAKLGVAGTSLSLASAAMTGYTVGAVIDSYVQGAINYFSNKE